MENPMKDVRDFFNQADYDRLVKELRKLNLLRIPTPHSHPQGELSSHLCFKLEY